MPTISPALPVTISSIETPQPVSKSLDTFVGLIIDASPDLSAFAPSAAFTPPSFIAVRSNAKSFTSPPRP